MSETKDWGRAIVGLDGSHGFALLGENLQEGEADLNSVHQYRAVREWWEPIEDEI